MVLFPSPKSFLLRFSLRRNRLKRSNAFFRRASHRSRTSKATSFLLGPHSRQMRRRENEMLVEILPNEVTVEILLRLPVKSLLRFMCVSKSWLCLITSPDFTELHYQRTSQHSNRVLVSADAQFQSIDFNVPFHDDPGVVKLNFPPGCPAPADLEIMGSCRGFLFLVVDKEQLLFLWNPSNGVLRMIPPVALDIFVYSYGFAYDESTDDYLVVLLSDFLACFSLKTESWEILDDGCPYVYQWDGQPTPGTIFNGAIHWVAKDCDGNTIVAFDIEEKILREIPLPDDFDYGFGLLGVVDGCLTLTENCDIIKMWVMKEYGVKSSWVKLYTMSANEAHIESIMPLCLNKDGQLVAGDSILGLSKLNDRGELLEHLKFSPVLYSQACASLYTETLLSLP